MKGWALLVALILAVLAPMPAVAKAGVAPLFASDEPIAVTIAGPVRRIAVRAFRATDPEQGTLTAEGQSYAVELRARGLTRRSQNVCQFPPLLVKIEDKTPKGSLFDKQHEIKLVTHCRRGPSFEPNVLREFAVYRLFNVLTDHSLKVRLARIRYVDGGDLVAERWGFFIEDIDEAARRMGGREIDVQSVPSSALVPAEAARYALFQYMIGNLDWDMDQGPPDEFCCHNSKLVGVDKDARTNLIPVPYDFDYSGLVDMPYAIPPPTIHVRSVRDRYFRGYCPLNDEVRRAVPAFIAARPALEAELAAITQLPDRDRKEMLRYLDGFFDSIDTSEKVERNLLRTCV